MLQLSWAGKVTVTFSEQVVTETERAIARKDPQVLNDLHHTLRKNLGVQFSTPDGLRPGAHLVDSLSPVELVDQVGDNQRWNSGGAVLTGYREFEQVEGLVKVEWLDHKI